MCMIVCLLNDLERPSILRCGNSRISLAVMSRLEIPHCSSADLTLANPLSCQIWIAMASHRLTNARTSWLRPQAQ